MKKTALFISIILSVLSTEGRISASEHVRIDTVKTKLLIRRPALEKVKSMIDSPSAAIDTLDTEHEHVKVILFGDNTWKYYKTPDFIQASEVFSEKWSETSVNPYGIEHAEMPDRWSIWLVDSLSSYHCPFQGDVYPRGKFGPRRGRRHQGVDLPLRTGEPIYATFSGKVRLSKYFGAYGNLVIIRHENGIETFYAHLSKRNVKAGDWVNAGDVIGLGGSTGRSTGPHLHFETRYKGFAFDPQWLIDFKTGDLRHRMFILKKKYFNIYSNYEQDFEDEFKNEEEDKAEDAERAAMKWHTVRSGDTLYKLARMYDTTVSNICKMNGINQNATLKVGKKLRVR